MSVKAIISKQYQDKVDRAAARVRKIAVPPEGWLCTARKALGMSAAQLARRLGVTRAQVSNTEKGELSGSVTMKTLQTMAETMGYRFVYVIVPEEKVQAILADRAKKKATRLVEETHKHMALEEQALSEKQISFEIERLQQDLIRNMPSDFWDDKG
ncbi:MAG: mobile mystery protein A [Nitrospirae bacterium]|nr:mobile mystery protein A [Nitrospirota bacterium]